MRPRKQADLGPVLNQNDKSNWMLSPKKKKAKPSKPEAKPSKVKKVIKKKPKVKKDTDPLAGKTIEYNWENPEGWFKGKVMDKPLTAKQREKGFTHKVRYFAKDTAGEINGIVLTDLGAGTQGNNWRLV
jgi:hypothetical protein